MNTIPLSPTASAFRISLLLLALAPLAHASAAEMPQPDRRVTYSTATNSQGEPVALQLHVFLPENWQAADSRPAVVFFFGGGWNGGKPSQFYPFCEQLAAHGMVCAAAEYRVKSRDGTPPTACVEDGRLDGKDYAATIKATLAFLTAQQWLPLAENSHE